MGGIGAAPPPHGPSPAAAPCQERLLPSPCLLVLAQQMPEQLLGAAPRPPNAKAAPRAPLRSAVAARPPVFTAGKLRGCCWSSHRPARRSVGGPSSPLPPSSAPSRPVPRGGRSGSRARPGPGHEGTPPQPGTAFPRGPRGGSGCDVVAARHAAPAGCAERAAPWRRTAAGGGSCSPSSTSTCSAAATPGRPASSRRRPGR